MTVFADKPPQYFTKPPRPTQPPTLSGMGNGYQSKCGDTLLYVVGQYGILCDLSRCSNKIESVGLRKSSYYHYLTKKVMPQ